jgi:integrase
MPARDRRHETAAAYPDLVAWIDYLDLEGKAARTLYAYERHLAPLLRRHPGKTVTEFTSDDVNHELRMVPPRSRYIPRSVYHSFFEWLLDDGRIQATPFAGRKVPKMTAGHRRPKDIFSPADIALLEACPIPDGPLFTVLFGTGIRKAEARHLKWGHVDLNRLRLVVYSGKGDKDRIIPFTLDVARALADLALLERLEPADHVWHRRRYPVGDHRRRRDPIGDTTFSTWWTDMLDAAGVRYLNPHQSRHTYAWTIRQAGLDLEERQALLGHENPETTVRQYGRVDIEEIAAKVAAL